jgi:hypothetical protein
MLSRSTSQPLALKLASVAVVLLCAAAAVQCRSSAPTRPSAVSPQQPTRLRITNGCEQPIWVFSEVGAGGGTLNAPGQVMLDGGTSYDYPIPDEGLAATRFWPGMGCDDTGNNCQLGQSGGPPDAGFTCPAGIGCAPAVDSKFEGTFGCLPSVPTSQCQLNPSSPGGGTPLGTQDNWDTSMVDGFTLPYRVDVKGTCSGGPPGNVIDCSGLKASLCPTQEDLSTNGQFPALSSVDLRLMLPNSDGGVAGCFSPCAKLTDEQWQSAPNPPFSGTTYNPGDPQAQMYCCPTPPISSGQCRAGPGASSDYVEVIHKYCPNTYAYAYDDGNGLYGCEAGAQYEVTFYCPQ